jgi:hypothetical protein
LDYNCPGFGFLSVKIPSRFSLIRDPVLDQLYENQIGLEPRSASLGWYAGFMAHLQRADSRELKEELRAVLAQHVAWQTRNFETMDSDLGETVSSKTAELEENGFAYFQIPSEVVDALLLSLGEIRLQGYKTSDTLSVGGSFAEGTHNYYSGSFTEGRDQLMNFPELVKIASNKTILAVAKNYLGALPRVASAELSLSRKGATGPVPSSDWHYDKGAISFLKLFLYLNDVDHNSGPHAYIKGSHNSNRLRKHIKNIFPDDHKINKALMKASRLTTDTANRVFPASQIHHAGPAGLAILEDTRGFHRAVHSQKGYRLMITLEWALDLATTGARCVPIPFASLSEKIKPAGRLEEQRFRYIFSEYIQ